MVTFVPGFIAPEAAEYQRETAGAAQGAARAVRQRSEGAGRGAGGVDRANPGPPATLPQVADHIDHIRKVAGIDHIGLGGDFDGITSVVKGLEDVSKYPGPRRRAAAPRLHDADVQEDPRRQHPARDARRRKASRGRCRRARSVAGDARVAGREEIGAACRNWVGETGLSRQNSPVMPRLTRIYTRKGDDGTTGLGGGQRVPKDSPRVSAYGTVDELSSAIGVALASGPVAEAGRVAAAGAERAVPSGIRPVLPRGGQGPILAAADRVAPRAGARSGDRRAERGRRSARELHSAGRIARRGAAARGPDRLPARRARGARAVATSSRSARSSSPTSIGSRTRCSSWRATRTAGAASRSRSGIRSSSRPGIRQTAPSGDPSAFPSESARLGPSSSSAHRRAWARRWRAARTARQPRGGRGAARR